MKKKSKKKISPDLRLLKRTYKNLDQVNSSIVTLFNQIDEGTITTNDVKNDLRDIQDHVNTIAGIIFENSSV